ncbi:phosphatidylinositol N-acetylglucosaminyltransferase subunit H isoform X2 [Calypte anna]|uniref:phosphatidylinositol N-acetylglucosaminyltransferase subunit H isoform X2 n=1 Tax=Calypte anna TaxID=9244 RepID=UPI0011C3C8DD|nr:phosphatidylinositol N-acetylglucosaminyltransferase subunit H isoform X2 [Calypte anna]
MEERRYRSASGAPIALRRRQHSASCRELSVRCPRLQLRSLSAATSAVWLAAYGLFVLSETFTWGDELQEFGIRDILKKNSLVLSAAIFITLIGLIIYLHFVKIDQESLLVIGSLGIQVTSSYASGKESTTFIEMSRVKDVVINEAIHMQKVIYYLCILLQDPGDPQGISEVVPLFQSSKPRLDCLIEVYKSCQEILEQKKTAPQSSDTKE